MKQSVLRTLIIMGLFIFSLSAFAAKSSDSSTIRWQKHSAAAFIDAKKTHRLVLIFGEADWCPWCAATKSKVFTDPMVIQVVNQYYVPVMLNIDEETMLARYYGIKQLPTFVVLDAKKDTVNTFSGYTEPQDMAAKLEGIALTNRSKN